MVHSTVFFFFFSLNKPLDLSLLSLGFLMVPHLCTMIQHEIVIVTGETACLEKAEAKTFAFL